MSHAVHTSVTITTSSEPPSAHQHSVSPTSSPEIDPIQSQRIPPQKPASTLPFFVYSALVLCIFIAFFIVYNSFHILNPHSFFVSLFSYYHNVTPRYTVYPMLSVQNSNEYALQWKIYLPPAYSLWSELHEQNSRDYYYTANAAMKSKPPLKMKVYYNGRELKVRNPDRMDQSWYEVRWKNQELHGEFSIRVSVDSWIDYYYWWVFHYNNRIETRRVDRLRDWDVRNDAPLFAAPVEHNKPDAVPIEAPASEIPVDETSPTTDPDTSARTPTPPAPSVNPSTPTASPQPVDPIQPQTQFQMTLNSILPSSIMYRRQQITHNTPSRDSTRTEFQIVWLSDNQMGHSAFRDVVRQIEYRHLEHTDLMVHGGDRIQRGNIAQEWHTHYHDIMQPLIRQKALPFINIVGNHDLGPSLFKWTTEEKFYEKTLLNGMLQLIVIDSLYDSQQQREWLERVLASSKAKFRIVCTHIPPFIEYWDPESWNFPKFEKSWNQIMQVYYAPVFERHSVSLVLSGHQHNYQRGKRANTHYVVSGGAGGELDTERVENYNLYDVTHFEHHYVVLKLQREESTSGSIRHRLLVEARNRRGNVIDTFTIAERGHAQQGSV